MIIRSILQMLLVQAIKAADTLAGQERVFDALIGDIIEDKEHNCAPIVIINSEDTQLTVSPSVFTGRSEQTFLISMAVLYADEKAANDPSLPKWKLPYLDSGTVIYLSRLERGILFALQPESGEAALLFHDGVELVTGKSTVGGGRKDGVRFAAREIHLTARMLAEPAPHKPASGWVDRALAYLENVPETAEHAALLRADIAGDPAALPQLAVLAERNMSRREAQLLGLGDLVPDEDGFFWLPVDGRDQSDKVLD